MNGSDPFGNLFSEEILQELMPADRADRFFEALYGDVEEGSYDIALAYLGHDHDHNLLRFELQLRERPGKCLACHLTYGLPEVFARHPLINIKGLVEQICARLAGKQSCSRWSLGQTRTRSRNLHAIPLEIRLG